MLWILIGIVITLMFSAMFSGMEIAFISAGKLNVEIQKNKGSRRGKLIADFYEDPNSFISTMLVGNNIMLVFFTILTAIAIEDRIKAFLEPNVIPSLLEFSTLMMMTLLTTIIVLIFGEFLPKVFFRLFADKILIFLAYPITFFRIILNPISWVMVKLSDWLIRKIVKEEEKEVQEVFTRLDLEKYVESSVDGENEEDRLLDTEMFSNVLYMKQKRVRDCMVPRTEVVAVEINDSMDELLEEFIDSSHSKILVYEDSIDQVVGYVHHQNMLSRPSNIKNVMRDIMIVPEGMWVNTLMNILIRNQISIACVVDEFGGTSGVITLEDILEEIFGEIEDEHDYSEEYLEEQINEREFRFSGRLEIDYLNEKFEELNFPEGDYNTLSGYIVMTTGTIPERSNQKVIMGDYTFILEMVSETKIETVRVILPDNKEEDN